MQTRNLIAAAALSLACSAGAMAQQATGLFASHNGLTTETKLPDGRKEIVAHYYILFVSNKPEDPLNNTAGDCVVNMIQSADAKTLSGSGVCFPKDVHGDGASLWWKIEESGTVRCPDQCGTFGYVDGYGRFKGVTGTGSWVRTHLFNDGSMGTITSTFTLPERPARKAGAKRSAPQAP